ncbi:MAG TPA: methionyl-tRNA formyltransferase [Burkholderiales bacterium]|nr:methionyl-tRNA formyltransferase [Burkholderiales bacterium]
MKIVFAGTPQFAAAALEALLAAGHEIPLVLTQPDKASGRGMKTTQSPVKMLALGHGLPVFQPKSLKNDREAERLLASLDADVMVVAAYGLILPEPVLNIPRLGCINIHASLLPRWRGAAPIQRAILAGDERTGITLMQMDAGLDTGDILSMTETPISAHDTGQTLHDRLAELGAKGIADLLSEERQERFPGKPQPEEGACYAAKLTKTEAAIDWRKDAAEIERMVRAFDPFPGACCVFEETPLKIWLARVVPGMNGKPGEALSAAKEPLIVACGKDALELLVLQKPGGKRLRASEFLSGFPVPKGALFT